MEPRKPEGKRINKGATHNFKKNPKPESHMEQEDRSGSEQEEEDFEDEWEEEDVIEEEAQPESKPIIVPFLGKRKDLGEDEQMEYANDAYVMFYQANTEWPSLSFDYVLENPTSFGPFEYPKNPAKTEYPLDAYIVTGSQADRHEHNALYLIRFADLCVSKFDDDEDFQESFEDLDPMIFSEKLPMASTANRIRSLHFQPFAAVMNESAQLQIIDLRDSLEKLKAKSRSDPVTGTSQPKIVKQFLLDQEGYGLAFAPLSFGSLAAGTNNGTLFTFDPTDPGLSDLAKTCTLRAHTSSIEDIVYSPNQDKILATCSADQTIKLFDLRTNNASPITIKAHDSDVNVISWNRTTPTMLASGAEDGGFKIWDLRKTGKGPLLHIQWHTDAITSIEWHPHDEWTLSVSSADDRLTLWDLSVEKDDQELANPDLKDVPDQMLFLHQGQENLKEARWHPQYNNMIVSTALNGYNVFEPAIDEEPSDDEEEILSDIKPAMQME